MLKSLEIKQEFENLQNSLKTKVEAKQAVTEEEQAKLAELKKSFEDALAAEQAERDKIDLKGDLKMNKVNGKMNDRAMKNKILRAILRGDEITDEMRASGYFATVGSYGQIGVITETITGDRGGYLVPEEFLDVERNGEGIGIEVPCRIVPVNKPTGKIPTFDVTQGAGDGKFLYTMDELAEMTKTHALFGQLSYTCVDKGGIVPISNRVLDDADADIVAMVSECFNTASLYQRSADVLTAVEGITNVTTEYLGSGKTFGDKEAMKAFIKTIRATLKGKNRAFAKIVMCDTDFAKLANLQMTNGEYYLKPMAYDASRYMVEGIEVIAVDDKLFTKTVSDTTTVGGYCFVGNFNKAWYINRKGLELAASNEAGFTQDALLVRGIKRGVAKILDTKAFVVIREGAAPTADNGNGGGGGTGGSQEPGED